MPLQPKGSAPYTTSTAATLVLDAWRERGFGVPVTADVLKRVGVPESLARRTLQSLVLLDLLDEDGMPTQQFQDFRATRGADEYRTRLQEWLHGIYADVLQYANPSTDSYDRVAEAFRSYEPAGQRRSMASLLTGLWKYAGLPVNAEGNGEGRPRRAPGRPVARGKAASGGRTKPPSPPESKSTDFGTEGLPPGLVGLLHQIPRKNGSWTSGRRDNFLRAFAAVLDYSVPVNDNPAPQAEDVDVGEADA